LNQSNTTTLTTAEQQKQRMRLLLLGALFVSCLVPILAAGLLGRDKNMFVIFFSTFMLGGIIGGLGLIMTFENDADWQKECRTFARGMLYAGMPLLFGFHLFLLSGLVPEPMNLKQGIGHRVGQYLVVERGGQMEVLVSEARYNFTDRVAMTMPGAFSLWDLRGVADGNDIRVVVQTERDFHKTIPTMVLPVDERALLTLYQRTLGQPLKEVMAEQVAVLAVRYLESLPAEERMGVKKLTLVWDVPVNNVFHGTGARLEGSSELTLLVQVLPKPATPAPILIQGQNPNAIGRIVPVSSLGV
jgi:hypothetical protein